MQDIGHKLTDEAIEQMRKKIKKTYGKKRKRLKKKLQSYFAPYVKEEKKKRTQLEDGEITEQEFEQWKRSIVSDKFIEEVAKDMTATNIKTAEYIGGMLAGIYATNHNWQTYNVETQTRLDTHYVRMTAQTAKTTPKPHVNKAMDILYNKRVQKSAMEQYILSGKTIPEIYNRYLNTTNMNEVQAMRMARTMATQVENKSRQEALERAEELGISIEKIWIATIDPYTRSSHRRADRQTVPLKEEFVLDGGRGMYPADPMLPPSELYNCRCTMAGICDGESVDLNSADVDRMVKTNMSYEEWLEAKPKIRRRVKKDKDGRNYY